MIVSGEEKDREVLALVSELAKAVKCCQKEGVFCEGVTFSQFRIMDAIGHRGAMGLSELHQFLGVDKSTTTRLLGPLIEHGLVHRERSRSDGRAVNLSLTREGAVVLGKVWDCLSVYFEDVRRGIPEHKRVQVYESVEIFAEAMKRASSPGGARIGKERTGHGR